MDIKKCWDESLELLITYDSLTVKEFIKLLRPMGFSKEVILDTLNKLMESPLAKYSYDKFISNI